MEWLKACSNVGVWYTLSEYIRWRAWQRYPRSHCSLSRPSLVSCDQHPIPTSQDHARSVEARPQYSGCQSSSICIGFLVLSITCRGPLAIWLIVRGTIAFCPIRYRAMVCSERPPFLLFATARFVTFESQAQWTRFVSSPVRRNRTVYLEYCTERVRSVCEQRYILDIAIPGLHIGLSGPSTP
jgi:hypothetical protein